MQATNVRGQVIGPFSSATEYLEECYSDRSGTCKCCTFFWSEMPHTVLYAVRADCSENRLCPGRVEPRLDFEGRMICRTRCFHVHSEACSPEQLQLYNCCTAPCLSWTIAGSRDAIVCRGNRVLFILEPSLKHLDTGRVRLSRSAIRSRINQSANRAINRRLRGPA